MFVFIYGTLKRGFSNHEKIKDISTFVCDVKSKEKHIMIDCGDGFPYLIKGSGIGFQILGELYEISEDDIHILDEFEGVPFLYSREEIEILIVDDIVIAQAYFKAEGIIIKEWN